MYSDCNKENAGKYVQNYVENGSSQIHSYKKQKTVCFDKRVEIANHADEDSIMDYVLNDTSIPDIKNAIRPNNSKKNKRARSIALLKPCFDDLIALVPDIDKEIKETNVSMLIKTADYIRELLRNSQ